MSDFGRIRRRKLPHIDVDDKPVFITGCLHGSLSHTAKKLIHDFRLELEQRKRPVNIDEQEWRSLQHRALFGFLDNLLNAECPVAHFSSDRLARVIAEAFLHFAEIRYHLLAFVVMPSHHHWLFLPTTDWVKELEQNPGHDSHVTPRESISHSIQSFTAHQCSRLLKSHGKFWESETYDHYARDEDEMYRIINYIEQNPIKAGIVSKAEEYRWSSAYLRSQLNIALGEPLPNGKECQHLWDL